MSAAEYYELPVTCDECGGDGGFEAPTRWDPNGGWQKCTRCKGTGEIPAEVPSMSDAEAETWGEWAESIIEQIGEVSSERTS